jgi:hypothetical protein
MQLLRCSCRRFGSLVGVDIADDAAVAHGEGPVGAFGDGGFVRGGDDGETVLVGEAELAALRAVGWTDSEIRELIMWEGALGAPCAAVVGGLLGVAATQMLVHTVPAAVFVTVGVLAVLAAAVTLAACLIPARLAARSQLAPLLTAE